MHNSKVQIKEPSARIPRGQYRSWNALKLQDTSNAIWCSNYSSQLQESVPLRNLLLKNKTKQTNKKSKHKSKTQNILSQLLRKMEYSLCRFGDNFESFTTAIEIKIRKKFKVCFVKNHYLHRITKSYKFWCTLRKLQICMLFHRSSVFLYREQGVY